MGQSNKWSNQDRIPQLSKDKIQSAANCTINVLNWTGRIAPLSTAQPDNSCRQAYGNRTRVSFLICQSTRSSSTREPRRYVPAQASHSSACSQSPNTCAVQSRFSLWFLTTTTTMYRAAASWVRALKVSLGFSSRFPGQTKEEKEKTTYLPNSLHRMWSRCHNYNHDLMHILQILCSMPRELPFNSLMTHPIRC